MNFRILISTILLSLSSMAAKAETLYDFSYAFNSVFASQTDVITGLFKGTPNGNVINNLSNISLSFNGVRIPADNNGFFYVNDGAQISFDGLENNFTFTSALADPFFGQMGTVFSSYNSEIFGTSVSLTEGPSFSQRTLGLNTASGGWPLFNQSSWTITLAAVPLPGAVWLFVSAVAGLGWLGKRRTINIDTQ